MEDMRPYDSAYFPGSYLPQVTVLSSCEFL